MSCDRMIGPYPCCSVVQGDCLELMKALPDGCVDAVITDPPYGIDGGRGGDARAFGKGKYSAESWEDTPEYVRSVVVPVISAASTRFQRMAVTPGNRCLHLYPHASDIGCFWSPAATTHGPWGFTTSQPILYYGRDFRAGKGPWPTGRLMTEAAEKNGHPCPKPEESWTWLVAKMSQDGETLLDPFCGSGTTLVAAKKLGRHFLGFEISPEYCEIARDRLARIDAQPSLFSPKPEQLSLNGGDDVR
jgi:predicted RNA methylase